MCPFAGLTSKAEVVDSSDGELERSNPVPAHATPLKPIPSRTVSTQTMGSLIDHAMEFAERSLSTLVLMHPIKQQFCFWDHVMSCMKMPRGGVTGSGSMHCAFEFVAANEEVVKHLMEDLPVQEHSRFNLTVAAPHWEASPSISTYHALDSRLLDSYFHLHRRLTAAGSRAYSGSLLASPPDGYASPVCILTACPPLLVEFCRQKHGKLVLAVSFNLAVVNDAGLTTTPASLRYATGMDEVIKLRSLNNLKKLHSRGTAMSMGLHNMAVGHQSSAPDSEGEWVPPPSELRTKVGLPPRDTSEQTDSGDEADTEEEVELRAARDMKRPRGSGTRWRGKLR